MHTPVKYEFLQRRHGGKVREIERWKAGKIKRAKLRHIRQEPKVGDGLGIKERKVLELFATGERAEVIISQLESDQNGQSEPGKMRQFAYDRRGGRQGLDRNKVIRATQEFKVLRGHAQSDAFCIRWQRGEVADFGKRDPPRGGGERQASRVSAQRLTQTIGQLKWIFHP